MSGVSINLASGQLGQVVQTADGVVGMVLTGAADTGGYALGTPKLIKSLRDLAAVGITEEDNPFAVKQVKEFYNEAGDGAELYLMLVDNTLTVADMADHSNAGGATKLLDLADGRIKILGVMSDDANMDDDVTVAHGLNGDVYTALTNMKVLAENYFNAQRPFRAIIGGTSYSGTATALTAINTGDNNRAAIVVGDTESGAGAALGLVLGRAAKISVVEKISKVATGSLNINAAYLNSSAIEAVPSDPSTIEDKGFITWKTFPHKSGYFFSGDPMATQVTDDYSFLARGRVIDKAHVITYLTFVQHVDGEIPIKDGSIDVGYCAALQKEIEGQINNTMTANKEISKVTCFIDPSQDVLATNLIYINLGITPMGYSSEIVVTLGFAK